ncbi:MAG: oligosaccharide flippase family protein [Chlorobi bacterium]|nr:oligosaccharide flippase family protein [Chlorobiota bacterium]MCI0716837.1 oligosaccharide flippase family protein [Chlorobiota bacterium]
MSTPIRKIFSDTIIYTAGSVFNRLLPFLLLPIYTYYFKPADYGVFSLVYSFWFFAAVFYLYGMETSFQKFFIEAKSIDEKKSIFSSTLILIFFTSVLFSLIIYILADNIALTITGDKPNGYLIRLLAIILVIDALYRFPMILINSEQRSKLYSSLNAIAVVINVASNVILIVFLKYGIEAIFYSYLVSYSFLFIASFIFSAKYFAFKMDIAQAKFLLKTAHLFLYYGLFLISMDLIDRFILEYFQGTAEVGIYSACYRIGIVMNLVITGFKVAWTPFFLNLKEEEGNKEIFSKIFTYFCYGGLIVFLTFSLFADDLVKINVAGYTLLNQNYWGGLFIIPYILMAYLFSGLYLNLTVASFLQNKIKYLIISSGFGCISNIAFNLILIPGLGMLGAAISTMLSYMLMFLILYALSQKIFRISYQWNLILKALVLTCILYAINIYLQNFASLNYIAKFIIEIFSVILLYLVLLGNKTAELLKTYVKSQP